MKLYDTTEKYSPENHNAAQTKSNEPPNVQL